MPKKKKKIKRKIETSKFLLLVSDTMAAITIVFTILSVFVLQDSSPLAYLIPAVFGLAATSHGFYYWKAKAENLNKWNKQGSGSCIVPDDDFTNNI